MREYAQGSLVVTAGGSLGAPEEVFKRGHKVSALPSVSYGTSVCCASVSCLLRCSPVSSLSSYLPHLIGFCFSYFFAVTKQKQLRRIYPCSQFRGIIAFADSGRERWRAVPYPSQRWVNAGAPYPSFHSVLEPSYGIVLPTCRQGHHILINPVYKRPLRYAQMFVL